MRNIALFLALALPLTGHAQQLLVEAESFRDPGGWQLDTQFIETMGSRITKLSQHQGFSADMWLAFQFQDGVREIVWPPEKATAPLVSCQ